MSGFELGENFPRWPRSPAPRIFQSLTNAFLSVGLSRNIQQVLVRGEILNDGRRFTFTVSTTGRRLFLSCLRKSPE